MAPLRDPAGPRRRQAGVGGSTLALGWLAAALAISIGMTVAFGEEKAAPIGQVMFHIPAQPLIDALQAYSRQAGVQVMFETAVADGQRSEPVEGDFTPETALRMLLADTDLRIRYSRTTAVTLAPASMPDPDEPPSAVLERPMMTLHTLHITVTREAVDQDRLGEFAVAVQSDIQKAVEKATPIRQGEYRVPVRLWINSRTVERAELDGTTGNHDRDSRIADILRGLTLSQQVPPNTPQPMRYMISNR